MLHECECAFVGFEQGANVGFDDISNVGELVREIVGCNDVFFEGKLVGINVGAWVGE